VTTRGTQKLIGSGVLTETWVDHPYRQGVALLDLFFAEGAAAEQRRERAIPLLQSEPDRFPDHFFSGPELPSDETIRRRFFGEE
jgi:hypothetical protein